MVRVNMLSFGYLLGNEPDSDGELILSTSCTPLEFGRAVQDAAEAVLQKHGLDGCKAQWVEYDFPLRELELLRSYVASWERCGD
jgi:hypothetical protein